MERQLTWGVHTGNPISLPNGTATPRAFAIAARLGALAFVWNTPVGMDIVTGDSVRKQVQIVDFTRWALIGLGVLTLLTGAQAARAELTRRITHG